MEGNTQETAAAHQNECEDGRTGRRSFTSEKKRGEHGVLGLTLSPQFGRGNRTGVTGGSRWNHSSDNYFGMLDKRHPDQFKQSQVRICNAIFETGGDIWTG